METFQSMFAAYGLLKEMVLDRRHWVKSSRSAAYHSASVGSAGHFVQTLKRAVEKNEEPASQTLFPCIEQYHRAPVELILNRQNLI